MQAASGSAESEPNPFMSDFPSPGSQRAVAAAASGAPSAAVSSAIGMFNRMGIEDFLSADGQADIFGSDTAMLEALNGSNVDVALGSRMLPDAASSEAPNSGKSTATPPPRPPPPVTANGTPRGVSPALSGAPHGRPATNALPGKSAFDDLNDSIRQALGGSPSRSAPLAQQQQQQQQSFQAGFAAFDPAAAPQPLQSFVVVPQPQTQLPVGYGSPAKQPLPGE